MLAVGRLLCALLFALLVASIANTRPIAGTPASSSNDLLEFYSYDKSLPLNPSESFLAEEETHYVYKVYYDSVNAERVPAFLVLPKADPPYRYVLVIHGLGGDKNSLSTYMRHLADNGFAVMSIDLPKHGERATGPIDLGEDLFYITTQGVFDIRRAVDYIKSRGDAACVALLARSMGGIISSIALGVDGRFKAGVLISTGGNLTTIFTEGDLSGKYEEVRPVIEGEEGKYIEPLNYIGYYKGALQFHFGTQDTVIPPSSSQQLADAAACEKEVYWYETGHAIPESATIGRILQFLNEKLTTHPAASLGAFACCFFPVLAAVVLARMSKRTF